MYSLKVGFQPQTMWSRTKLTKLRHYSQKSVVSIWSVYLPDCRDRLSWPRFAMVLLSSYWQWCWAYFYLIALFQLHMLCIVKW
jgi:hypothetical protein